MIRGGPGGGRPPLYAATPGLVSAAEIHGPPFFVDDVVQRPIRVVDGAAVRPLSAGLGVVVDEAAVARHRLRF